jgi:hypothetical protein
MGQSLDQHLWKNRLLLVLGDTAINEQWQDQLLELDNCKPVLRERKIITYQVLPEKYKQSDHTDWVDDHAFYRDYQTGGTAFTIILIGLDGGIKVNSNDLLNCQQIAAVIDQMPMRKAELRRRSGTNK